MTRSKRYHDGDRGRPSAMKVGGAVAAVLVGAGAVAGGVALATHHDSLPSAGTSAYSLALGGTQSAKLSYVENNADSANIAALVEGLDGYNRQFSVWQNSQKSTLAFSRGKVVFIGHKFLIVRTLKGKLVLWLLSGKTVVKAVATTAAEQETVPAAVPMVTTETAVDAVTGIDGLNALLDSTTAVDPAATTITIADGASDVTVTVTGDTTVAPTVTVATGAATSTVPAASEAWDGLAAGDPVFVAGSVTNGTHHAALVLVLANGSSSTTSSTTSTVPGYDSSNGPSHW